MKMIPLWLIRIICGKGNCNNRYEYINNSLHLVRKYAQIFVRGHYLFRKVNSFPRAKLEENCELQGTGNVQGQISKHIFAAKLRLLCLLSMGFKNWGISSDIPQFQLGNLTRLDQ